eukprot:1750527-Alexandrium_andersonii.AAC.1
MRPAALRHPSMRSPLLARTLVRQQCGTLHMALPVGIVVCLYFWRAPPPPMPVYPALVVVPGLALLLAIICVLAGTNGQAAAAAFLWWQRFRDAACRCGSPLLW